MWAIWKDENISKENFVGRDRWSVVSGYHNVLICMCKRVFVGWCLECKNAIASDSFTNREREISVSHQARSIWITRRCSNSTIMRRTARFSQGDSVSGRIWTFLCILRFRPESLFATHVFFVIIHSRWVQIVRTTNVSSFTFTCFLHFKTTQNT